MTDIFKAKRERLFKSMGEDNALNIVSKKYFSAQYKNEKGK